MLENIKCEEREVFPWSPSFGDNAEILPFLTKRIYTFNDVLENETKTDYFKRKGYITNFEYLGFLLRKIIQEDTSLTLKFQLRDILPVEYGGDKEWALKTICGVDNSVFVKKRVSNRTFTSLFTIDTVFTKAKYFKKNPIDVKYLSGVFSILYDTSNGFTVNPMLDDLIPVEFSKQSEWVDLTSKNKKRRLEYKNKQQKKIKQSIYV